MTELQQQTYLIREHLASDMQRLCDTLGYKKPARDGHSLRYGRRGSLAVIVSGADAGRWFNHEHGEGGDPFALIMHTLDLPFRDAKRWAVEFLGGEVDALPENSRRPDRAAQRRMDAERVQRSKDKAKAIWQATAPADETLAHYYLFGERNIEVATLPPMIRFHSALDYWHDGSRLFTSAAMVCKIVNVETGEAQGVHVTYLDDFARKNSEAPNGHARKMRGVAKAGCIRLGNPGSVMAVAEGIESALAFTHLEGVPCDAALSADGMANYTPPPECKGLLICHDNDASEIGRRAGQSLAARMVARGIECAFKPAPVGSDWNDYLMGVQS